MNDSLQTQLETQLALYQASLRIPEWRIRLEIVPCHELPENAQATCRTNPHLKTAIVRIMDPADEPYRLDETWPYCPFETLAHEAAHVLMDPLEAQTADDSNALEFAVNVLADMLMTLHPRP